MAHTGINSIVTSFAAGRSQRLTANRIINTGATSAAGRWHEAFAVSNGTGGIGVLTGTAGVGVAMTAATAGSLPLSPAAVPGFVRHLMAMSVRSSATTLAPGEMRLLDLLYQYPSCSVTTGAGTVINNGASKPTRFGTGDGVRCACIVSGTAIGAAFPVITVSYTNSSGVSGRTGFFAASAASQPIGSFLTGAAVATLSGPQMLMQAGDSGVQQINSYTVATGTTGTVCFVLHRDIADVPIIAANTPAERDYLSSQPQMPVIADDACLAEIVMLGGALTVNQTIQSTLLFNWG